MTYYTSRKKTLRGGHFMTYYTKGYCAYLHVFNTSLCCSKLTHSCRVSEWREGKRERQVMLPLVLLIKFALLLIIFQISFSFNLLVANWRLSPEFWSPNFFSLAMATKMVAAWSTEICSDSPCGLRVYGCTSLSNSDDIKKYCRIGNLTI